MKANELIKKLEAEKEQTTLLARKPKHTPGKWHLRKNNIRGWDLTIGPEHAGRDTLYIGLAGGSPEQIEEDKANAVLLRAAPDLLEVCEEISDAVGVQITKARIAGHSNEVQNWQRLARKLNAAILYAKTTF